MEQMWCATGEPRGLLLVGHGTRDQQGRSEFLRTARLVARRAPDLLVEPCYLELASPTIGQGVRRLADRGAQRLTVAPLLLFSAGHAKRDIPLAVREAIQGTRFTQFDLAQHLGCHPGLDELSRRRSRQAVAGLATASADQSLLLLVGRGSNDPEATAEMFRFAELRSDPAMFQHLRTAFLAMARPGLDEMLVQISSLAVRRVVVQPHLLFHGELLNRLRDRVERTARGQGDQLWVVTRHLGPSKLLADVILDRCRQSRSSQDV